jgi:hypothetical protein
MDESGEENQLADGPAGFDQGVRFHDVLSRDLSEGSVDGGSDLA